MPGLDKNRKRNLTVSFRATPEENELVNLLARTAHMTKQEYIMAKLTDTQVVVKPNSRTYRALKDEMRKVCAELARIRQAGGMSDDLVLRVELLTDIFIELGQPEAASQVEAENAMIAKMARG